MVTTSFDEKIRELSTQGRLGDIPENILEHWRSQIALGCISPDLADGIPLELSDAKDRLLRHLKPPASGKMLSDKEVYTKYAPVFVSTDITGAVEVVMEMEDINLRIDIDMVGLFLSKLTKAEVSYRFNLIRKWMDKVNVSDVTITPVIAEFLSKPGDFASKLTELEVMMEKTKKGRFQAKNPLHRDLEYRKFSHEYARLHGTNRRLPYVDKSFEVLYREFVGLEELVHEHHDDWHLGGEFLKEAKRLAYEASLFLRFLFKFREGTSRPIIVVGNNRYGRQWVVEPLEKFLQEDFEVRYCGVPSHMSMKLSVPGSGNFEWSADNTGPWTPDAFSMELVRRFDHDMPHIIVADAKGAHGYAGNMMLSRAAKNYVHWFAAFNDVRAEGHRSQYWPKSSLPEEHMYELVHWYEFVRLRRQLSEWVNPGSIYKVGLWAPEITEETQLGELRIPYSPPEMDTDEPQAVVANSIIYDPGNLPEGLRDTTPYFFDGPEKHVQEEIVFGFGPYGFQPIVKGTMTATFVAAVQKFIMTEVERLISM